MQSMPSSPTGPDARISHFAAEHHGVFPRSVALEAGVTPRQIARRVTSGRWARIHDEVYRAEGSPTSPRAKAAAACFAVGSDAFASHRTSAFLWGLPGGRDDIVEVTTRRWRRTHDLGFVVHESARVDDCDIDVVDNIRVGSAELTVMQLGAVCSPLVVEMALDRALLRDLLTLASMRELVERLGARGRNGIGVVRALLDQRSAGDSTPESPKETQLLRLLLANGLPKPVAQHEVWHDGRFAARVDFAYPDVKLAIEYDSYEHHTGKLALRRDRLRNRALLAAGWQVIGVTDEDLKAGAIEVAKEIRAVLNRR